MIEYSQMGFIERLRLQKEAVVQIRSQQEAVLQRKNEAEAIVGQQREAQEKEYHRQRSLQAETFRQESGIGLLVVELGRFLIEEGKTDTILQGKSALKGFPNHHGYSCIHGDSVRLGYTIAPLYDDWGYRSITYPPISAVDQDSVFDIAMWDFKGLAGKRSSPGRKGDWEKAEQKFLAVESRPDGNIVFHARKSGTKSKQEWRASSDILDKALEEAFCNPRIYKFEYHHLVPWEESS